MSGWSIGQSTSLYEVAYEHIFADSYSTSEEGARFQRSMCASGVWAGAFRITEAWNLTDAQDNNITLLGELNRLGYLGDIPCSATEPGGYLLGAHFELHIEQGPILEQRQKVVGVVNSAQAYQWYTFKITGKDAHTGTTPFGARRDPVLAAAKMIAAANELAKKSGALASTGWIKVPTTSSINTIASQVIFTLDIRHAHNDVVRDLHQRVLETFYQIAIADGQGVHIQWSLDFDSPSVEFHPDCVRVTREAARKVVGEQGVLDMTSGAGHDSVFTNRHCPTSMIFVPCKDGVSHHPTEYCSPEHW